MSEEVSGLLRLLLHAKRAVSGITEPLEAKKDLRSLKLF